MDKLTQPRPMWRIVLIVSLVFNFAVVGVLGGMMLAARGSDGPPSRMSFGLGPVTQALDRADRRAIAQDVRGKLGRQIAPRSDMQSLVDVLIADPFDGAALHDLLTQRSDQTAAVVSAAQQAFVDRVSDMTPDQRQRLADRIGRKRHR